MPVWRYSKNKEVLREFGLDGKPQFQTVSFDWSFGGRGIQQAVRAEGNLSARDVTVGATHIEVRVETRKVDESYLREKNKWGVKQRSDITEGDGRKSTTVVSDVKKKVSFKVSRSIRPNTGERK